MYTPIDYGPGKWQVAPQDKIELQVDFITVEFADKKKTPVPAANQIAGISGILLINNKKNYKLISQIKKKIRNLFIRNLLLQGFWFSSLVTLFSVRHRSEGVTSQHKKSDVTAPEACCKVYQRLRTFACSLR